MEEVEFLHSRVHHYVRGVVDDLLEVAKRHADQVAELGRERLEEPDVADGHREFDVPHPLTAHLRERYLHSAPVAHMATEADPLEFTAVTFPVLYRPENPLAEQPVLLGLEGPVVDGLGLSDFAI